MLTGALYAFAPLARAQTETPLTLTNEGWTIAALAGHALLEINHERLGTVLQDVQLNLQTDSGLQ